MGSHPSLCKNLSRLSETLILFTDVIIPISNAYDEKRKGVFR